MLDEAVEPLRLRGRPFISPKKVLNDPNDLKVFKDFKDLVIIIRQSQTIFSYLWLRLRYSRSGMSK